jgi:hypothetical protein
LIHLARHVDQSNAYELVLAARDTLEQTAKEQP